MMCQAAAIRNQQLWQPLLLVGIGNYWEVGYAFAALI